MSRISQLTELTTPHDNDLLPIVDVSDTTQASSGSTKYIKVGNLPIQSGVVTDADLQAALTNSPALGGTPTAPTADQDTNSTQIATTEFVRTITDSIVSSPVTRLEPLFWDRIADEVSCASTIPNAATYAPAYDAALTGTVSGSTFTITGGDDPADFGTGTWAAVLVIGTDYYHCIALSRSGSTVTITPPAPSSGAATLAIRHRDNLGQHYNEFGGRAMARSLYYATFEPTDCVVRLSPRYVHGQQSPSYWKVFNGAPANFLENRVGANQFTAEGVWIQRGATATTRARAGNGQGVELDITLEQSQSGFVKFYLGHQGPIGQTATVTLFADGVQVAQETNYGFLLSHKLKFPATKSLKLRIVSNYSAGNLDFRIGDVSVHSDYFLRPFLRSKEKLLVIGDSWTTTAFPGFVEGLQDLHDGVVVSEGVGGTTAGYHLAEVDGVRRIDAWIAEHQPDVCVVHSYINDRNQDIPQATWSRNILEICRACTDKGVQPVVVLPGVTTSTTQTQSLQTLYSYALDKPQRFPYPNVNKSLDFTDALSAINQVSKTPGRAAKDSEGLKVYVASGPNPSDVWFDVQSPSSVVIPKTFEGALVVLSEMLRFYGCATQGSGTLDDSSSANVDGTASGTIDYGLDVFGIARRYFSLGTSEYVDCGGTGVIPSTANWTIGAWVRPTAIASEYAIFAQTVGGGGLALTILSGQARLYLAGVGIHSTVQFGGGSVSIGAWHHIAARRSGNVFTVWLNGSIVGTQTDADATRTIQATGNLVGGWGFGTYNGTVLRHILGDLADVFVSNSALSDAEMAWMASNQNYII